MLLHPSAHLALYALAFCCHFGARVVFAHTVRQVTTTVCDVGCLMSSISMAIGENNILIAGQTSNPGTLNAWLRTNNGCAVYVGRVSSPPAQKPTPLPGKQQRGLAGGGDSYRSSCPIQFFGARATSDQCCVCIVW
jgi:hypothetical protein